CQHPTLPRYRRCFDRRGRTGRQGSYPERMVPAGGPRSGVEAYPTYIVSTAAQPGLSAPAWRADLALVFNTLVWGTTFVMVKRALDDASALLFVAIRFLMATIVIAWLFRKRWSPASGPPPGGILAGCCLFGGYAFQTAGLKLTTPSKAAFLTGLAVVLVP